MFNIFYLNPPLQIHATGLFDSVPELCKLSRVFSKPEFSRSVVFCYNFSYSVQADLLINKDQKSDVVQTKYA